MRQKNIFISAAAFVCAAVLLVASARAQAVFTGTDPEAPAAPAVLAAPPAPVAPAVVSKPRLPTAHAAPQAVAPQSLSGSYVAFDSSGGGDTCYTPGESQTLCFRAESFTNDYEYVYNVWVRFPSDWSVTSADVQGTPVCSSGANWGSFNWSFQTSPYEVNIYHPRYQLTVDHCTAYYCFDVTPAEAGASAPVSWYWDGDGYAGTPHWPCSDDGYTPAGQNACDQAVNPQAQVPACGSEKADFLTPDNQTDAGCNGDNATYTLSITNKTGDNATFTLSYSVPSLNGTLAGPASIFVADNATETLQVTLATDLCLDDGDNVTGQIRASGNGYYDNATVTYTIDAQPEWQMVSDSAPGWAGGGYPVDGCTARNAAGDLVTYIIGDTAGSINGFNGYNHDTNSWFDPGATNTPANRWAPDWAYDADTNLCYVTGGATAPGAGNLNEAYVYDPVANAFTQLGSFTTVRDFHDSWVGTIDSVKYLCIGGGNNGGGMTSTQCYDLSQSAPGAWNAENAQMGVYPTDVWGAADGVLHAPTGDQFWSVAGAQSGSSISDQAWYFDDADNSWHSAGNTGSARYRLEGDFLGGDFYQIGGAAGSFNFTSTVARGSYNGSSWDWELLDDMNNARLDNIANVADGKLWSIDGYGSAAMDYVEYRGRECYVCCDSDNECDDGQYCNGLEFCDNGACVSPGDPCAGDNATPFCDEDNDTCVECLADGDCPDDSLFCTGAPTCINNVCGFAGDPCAGDNATPFCDEDGDTCVECLADGDCPDDSLFCTGAPICTNNVCGFAEDSCEGATPFCNEDTDTCVECLTSGDCPDDGLFCTGAPTCTANACGFAEDSCEGETSVCDEAGDRCVGCLADGDCAGTEWCRENVCVPRCELTVTHKTISAAKLFKARKVVLKVTSADPAFDIYGRIDLGPLTWNKVVFGRKKNHLKIHATVPAGMTPQTITIWVGDCYGEVVITP